MKKKKIKFMFVILIITLFFNVIEINGLERKLLSATEYDYPPFSITSNGKAEGFSVELLCEVAYQMGMTIDFELGEWADIKEQLKNGDIDVLPLVGYSEKRDKYYDFTDPYIVMKGNIFVKKGNQSIKSEEDLYGKKIIVMNGDNYHEVAKQIGYTAQLILTETYTEAFLLLSEGNYDAVLAQSLVGEKIISKENIKNIEAVTVSVGADSSKVKITLDKFEQKFSFAVKEGDKELLALLNEGLAVVYENGKYEELYSRWFTFSINNVESIKTVGKFLAIILLPIITIFLIIFFIVLKKQVKAKTEKILYESEINNLMSEIVSKDYMYISDVLKELERFIFETSKCESMQLYTKDTIATSNGYSLISERHTCRYGNENVTKEYDDLIIKQYIKKKSPIYMLINNEAENQQYFDFNSMRIQEIPYRFAIIPVVFGKEIEVICLIKSRGSDFDINYANKISLLVHSLWNNIEKNKSHKKIKSEKELYQSTILSINDGLIIVDKAERILILNPAAKKIIGVNNETYLMKKYTTITQLYDENIDGKPINPFSKKYKSENEEVERINCIMETVSGQKINIEFSVQNIDIEGNNNSYMFLFRDVTEIIGYIREIENISKYDFLTKLYNRRYFESQLKNYDKEDFLPLTLVVSDLNNLKLVNDAFGHKEGDELLILASEYIKKNITEDDILCRWGGDEFAIIMPSCNKEKAKNIIDKINFSAGEYIDNKKVLSIAFGFETKTSMDQTMDDVFKKAEYYMYKNKTNNREDVRGTSINMILEALFEKSPRERAHSERVSIIAKEIAEKLNLQEHMIKDIQTLGRLHDIGKTVISIKILDKPDKLGQLEFEEIKKHTSIGYRILKSNIEFSNIADGVLNHHEKWDGSGYPNGKKGEMIPLYARIVAIADAYDTMVTGRPYKEKTEDKDLVLKEFIEQSGKQFDPKIIDVFIREVLVNLML